MLSGWDLSKKTSCRHETQLRQRNQHEVSQEFYGQGVGGTRAAANEQLLQILKSLPLNPQSHGTVLANSFQITILQTKKCSKALQMQYPFHQHGVSSTFHCQQSEES